MGNFSALGRKKSPFAFIALPSGERNTDHTSVSNLIYVETTIPSFYHENRQKPEIIAMRNWTREWWHDAITGGDQLVISDAVLAELDLTPEPKRSECLALTAGLPVLDDPPEIDETVEFYIAHKLMPASLAGDARHLALATWHTCDILATWNCRHIANPNKLEHIHHIHDMLGLHTPVLATPYQLLEANK